MCAHVRAVEQMGSGAQVAARSAGDVVFDNGVDAYGLVKRAAIAGDHVGEARVGAKLAVFAHMRVANQVGLGPYHGVASNGGVRANPSLGGVDEGDALSHELVVDAVAGDGGELSQLGARVDAKAVAVVFAVVDAHGMAGGFKDLEHVGQVILALGVIAGDVANVGGKQRSVKGVAAGVAFEQLRGLLRRAVLLLDDAGDDAVGIKFDAAVPKGVGRGHGEHGGRQFAVCHGLGKHAHGFGLDKG